MRDEEKKERRNESYTFIKVCLKKNVVGHWMGKILDGHVCLSRAIRMHDLHTNIHISFIACATGSNVRVLTPSIHVNRRKSREKSERTFQFRFVGTTRREIGTEIMEPLAHYEINYTTDAVLHF